jgi:hypothetical protein
VNAGSHYRRFGPIMWGAIGVAIMIMAVVAVYRLDPQIAGYTVGVMVLVCLALCAATFWLDGRTARATDRLVDQLRQRSSR